MSKVEVFRNQAEGLWVVRFANHAVATADEIVLQNVTFLRDEALRQKKLETDPPAPLVHATALGVLVDSLNLKCRFPHLVPPLGGTRRFGQFNQETYDARVRYDHTDPHVFFYDNTDDPIHAADELLLCIDGSAYCRDGVPA